MTAMYPYAGKKAAGIMSINGIKALRMAGFDEMDMAGLVLGMSLSLTWRGSDIVIFVNDGRSGCISLACCLW